MFSELFLANKLQSYTAVVHKFKEIDQAKNAYGTISHQE
jgi:hypothetical protein